MTPGWDNSMLGKMGSGDPGTPKNPKANQCQPGFCVKKDGWYYRVLKGGCPSGGGNWGNLEDS